jgi:acyl-coenzyme A thioesterase 13
LTDTVTSLAISTLGVAPPTGASINISCEFVRPAGKVGDDLYSVGEVIKLGRTTAFTKVTFYDKSDKIVAFGSHTKHMGDNKATKRFSDDGENELPLEESRERSKL